MQECTLHVDGCRPIYNKGVCCPVRYDCGKLSNAFLMHISVFTPRNHKKFIKPIFSPLFFCFVLLVMHTARDDDLPLMLEDQTTTEAPSQGFIITTTSAPVQ